MAKTPAPSAKAALKQATARWPKRSTVSDGIVPSAAHTKGNPNSDHEPGKAGYCHAFDLTHDPKDGCDCARIVEDLRLSRDSRVKYVIFDRRIFSSYRVGTRAPWAWGYYSGSNPHSKHMHCSIRDTKDACLDVSPWPGIAVSYTKPKPKTPYRVVKVASLRLRDFPSLRSGKTLEMLHKGDKLTILGTGRWWVKVRHGKHVGYVWKAYTKLV